MKIKAILELEIDIDEATYNSLDVNVVDAVGDAEAYREIEDRARSITTQCISAEIIEEEVGLYELFKRTFGFEPCQHTIDAIKEDVSYAVIDEGASLKRVFQLAKDYYDKHKSHQDDIAYCFEVALSDEGLI
ncbi:hypothetical protein J5TS2_40760 [Brevibacillus halotolerans]|uniref:hypothetical protein n=1 Tax=Brevibacillus halotolerans TaxID=1507437 RepID=UPI001B1FEEA3|nr:hypothetical protein [Brevibacillus halotolerans]GIO03408.1 hypothetical protein J5TS2_40760 [Brevibacillus halotolerans]